MAFVGKTSKTCFYPGCEQRALRLLYCAHHSAPSARREYRRGEESEAEIEEVIAASTTQRTLPDGREELTITVKGDTFVEDVAERFVVGICVKPDCDDQAVPIAPGSTLRLYCKEHLP